MNPSNQMTRTAEATHHKTLMAKPAIRIITGDVARLVEFYARATGAQATWANEDFAELKTAGAIRPGLCPPGG
ncbi:hypothetical protein GCM10009665_37460 [Kitasatospora nipponensis]|uniref:Glyoxalase-like domain-containing protein n=1 Tax=Kitasatospora nipponensis TaxID=258049 RepID=A0ABN1WD31_9ACTN